MSTYSELKNIQPELVECFFAFSNQQFEEGKKKAGIEDKKIYKASGGLFGTHEGIKKLYDDYDAISKRITAECDPQEVYDYEFGNHECSYTCDDTEAIKIVAAYFDDEKTKTVKRRFAYTKIEDLDFSIYS